jgi:hypothetical protein
MKWGESFLKSGLPLEHLTVTTLTALGWWCAPKWEYRRVNRELELKFFEVDLVAHAQDDDDGNHLMLLTECKYHDEQRFWFFLPCSTLDHQAQYEAMSAGQDLESDEEVLHYGPYIPLRHPQRHTLAELAPLSVWGVTVSQSGQREDNAIHNALEQLAFAFVPFCLEHVYHFCADSPAAVVPAIVTTAKLFRLKPEIQSLDSIRQASMPRDIADELPWTWCYYASRGSVLDHNHFEIDLWKKENKGLRWPGLDDQLASLWCGLHWVLVVNIDNLGQAAAELRQAFIDLPKDFSRNRQLLALMNSESAKARRRRRAKKAASNR